MAKDWPFSVKLSTVVVVLVLCYIFSIQTVSSQIAHGQTCDNSSMPCQANLICDTNSKCNCSSTDYYDPSSSMCKTKIAHGQTCNNSMPCQANLICDTNSKCNCSSTEYYDPSSSMCKTKIAHGQTCDNSMPCQANLICDTNSKCNCSSTEYYDESSSTCKTKIAHGQTCDNSSMPCQANLICDSNSKCNCPSTEYYDQSSSTCKKKIDYNDSCDGINSSTPNVCKESNTVCNSYFTDKTKKCLCAGTFYRANNNTCISQSNLIPQDVNGTRSTHSIDFTWMDTSNRNDISYSITWNGTAVNANKTGINIIGLSPGREYNFSVNSTLPADNNYPSIEVQWPPKRFWTYPAKPGPVTGESLTSDSLSKPFQYKVPFEWPLEGNVAYCSVNITEVGNMTVVCSEKTSTSPPFVMCELDPAKSYNYTLKCYNGNTPPDESEPVTGLFQTQPAGSGPVQYLNSAEILEYTANITWQIPSEPNGKIKGYLVQVKRQENGTCLYNIKVSCPDCDQLQVNDTSCSKTETGSVSYSNSNVHILTLPGLRPYHNYTIVVRAVNENGTGVASTLNLTTDIGVANNILNLSPNSATEETSHQVYLNISWVPGEYTGPTTYYILVQKEEGLDTKIYDGDKLYNVSDYYTTTFVVNDVLAYWNYQISVRAATIKANSSWSVKQVQTAANRPGIVQNLTVVQDTDVARKLSISFVCPEEQDRNGTINKFVIRRTLLGSDTVTDTNYTASTTPCLSGYSFIDETDILVEENYTVSILTVNNYGEGEFGNPVTVYVQPKAPQLTVTMEKLGVKNLIKQSAGNEEKKINVDICGKCLLDDSQGTVTNGSLLVCVKPCTDPGRKRRAVTIEDFAKYPTWGAAKVKDFKIRYRTTPNDWIKTLKGGDSESYVIGGNESCGNPADYCNGPLPAGKEFIITVIVCTKAGCDIYKDDQVFVTSKTEETPVGAIVGGVLGGLALIAVICVIVFLIIQSRRRNNNPTRQSTFRIDDRIKLQRPVKLRNFNEHVLRFHKDQNLLFQDEFENIQTLSKTFKTSCNEAQRESNRVKNRYVDILPFDHSRVKLDILPDDDDTNDFINANYIRGYNSVREYIATQGPMFCTIPDFWRMVWEQNCKLVVMLSDLMEGGKRKVDLYWPEDLNEPINYGTVVVEMTNFSQLNHYIIRNFKVTKGEESRKITHFFLPGWSDFSADVGFDVIQGFVKMVRQEATPVNPGPIIVHCSAGVGRTGTLIAIDYFTQFVEKHSLDEEIDIFDFVVQMRKNRTRMVQVESQYIFIYDVINKVIQKKIKAEEEKLYENSSNGVYANMGQPEENIYENTALKNDKYVYNNEAFEPEISNIGSSQKNEKPTTEL